MPLEHVKGFVMQNISNKDSAQSSIHSTSNCVDTHPSWLNSSASNYPPSYPKNLYMNMALAQHANQLKHLADQIADQDSSSTQSTGQSHHEVSGSSEGNIQEQSISAQSGNDSTYEKHVEGHMKSALTLGPAEVAFLPPKLDYNPSVACIPYAYADPYYGGVLAAYGSHATMIHPQMMGMAPSSRVPLPHEQAEEEPIYVNAKQYHAILRRRELRAKQEAQNKLVKGRKPYLHESRHKHAMKRARGVGGRFLNTKKLQQQAQSIENGGIVGSTATPSCSEVTCISNGGGSGGFHHQDHFGFSTATNDFQSHIMGNGQGGGPQHRVPVMR